MRKTILFAVLAVGMLASCNKQSPLDPASDPERVTTPPTAYDSVMANPRTDNMPSDAGNPGEPTGNPSDTVTTNRQNPVR